MMGFKSLTSPILMMPLITGITLSACGGSQVEESTTQGVQAFDPILGEAHDAWLNKSLNQSCVRWNVDDVAIDPPNVGQVSVVSNMDYHQVQDLVSGNAQLEIDLESLNVEGAVDYASEFSESSFVSSLTVYQSIANGRIRLPVDSGKLKLNNLGESLALPFNAGKFRRECGTEFVSEKELHGLFMGTLFFRFANLSDKMRFDAKLKVEIAGFGGLSGQVQTILNEVGEHASVRFRALQQGGTPLALSKALSDKIADCSADNRGPCYEAFGAMEKYLQEFSGQFRVNGQLDPQRFALRNVRMSDYHAVDNRLESASINPGVLLRLATARERLSDKVLRDTANLKNAQSLLLSQLPIGPHRRAKIRALADNSKARLKIFANALQLCYGEPSEAFGVASCEASIAGAELAAQVYDYDEKDLVVVSHTFEDYCGMLQAWQAASMLGQDMVASGIMDNETRSSLLAILNSPVVKAVGGKGRVVVADGSSVSTLTSISPDKSDFKCSAYAAVVQALTTLNLQDKQIGSVEVFSSLPHLRALNLSNNKFQYGVSSLESLSYLETLTLDAAKLKNLDGFSIATLRELSLRDNMILPGELAKLSKATALEMLDLSANKFLDDVSMLPDLPKLKKLVLSKTGVTRAQALALLHRVDSDGFPRLQKLELPASACDMLFHPQVELICE